MHKLESFGRLVKWCIEFSEFYIQYRSRNAIKGQALADFVANYTAGAKQYEANSKPNTSQGKEEVATSVLLVDGSSSSLSCGASVVVISPDEVNVSYALRFEFETSNNEAEYEELIIGLKIAKTLGAKKLKIKSDS